ncbi:response regulator [Marinospirillum perlucidum]|uniref:response regulator n=1 Tax=Marinospirillum perlucidum TaxID=1982602 RepID=UPI000DF33285|nr:response regulator [Marinospirillum perlucidum]
MSKKDFRLLLIDDDEADAFLTRMALEEARFLLEVEVCQNGQEALERLQQGETPDLILLDLNMPRMSGFEFLQQMKQQDCFKPLPVVVLTTSSSSEDINRAYALGAVGFLTKPVDMNDFIQALRGLENYWLELVRLPQLAV